MQLIEIAIYGIALSQLKVINFIYFILFNLFINSVFFNKILPNVPQMITNCQKRNRLVNTCVNKYKKLNDVLQITIILFKLLFIYIFRYLFNYNAYGIRIITNNFVNKLKIYHEINNDKNMSNIFLTDITNKNLSDESTEESDGSEQYNITEYDNDSTDGEQENENPIDDGYYEDSDTEKETEQDEEADEEPGEKVKTFSLARLSEKSEDFSDNEQDEEQGEEQDEQDEDQDEQDKEYPILSSNDISVQTDVTIPHTIINKDATEQVDPVKPEPKTMYNYVFSFFNYV
jgi:hypothetical protein